MRPTKKCKGFWFYPKHFKIIKDFSEVQGISQSKMLWVAFLQYMSRENKYIEECHWCGTRFNTKNGSITDALGRFFCTYECGNRHQASKGF